jgi:hypothetical protein
MQASGLKHDGFVGPSGGNTGGSSSFAPRRAGSGGEGATGTPRESYSGNFGTLEGYSIYYANIGPAASAGL